VTSDQRDTSDFEATKERVSLVPKEALDPSQGARSSRRASGTTAQEAALIDAVVVPRWSTLFGRAIVARIPKGIRAQVLDIGCGTGHPAFDILHKLGDGGRVIAIDRDHALVDLARRRALEEVGRRIFFKIESAQDMSFGDEVFDIAVGNLVAGTNADDDILAELLRVLAPSGRLLLTRPLSGTFDEVLDMFREVAILRDDTSLTRRIEQLAAQKPTRAAWQSQLEAASFEEVKVDVEEVRLPFHKAREIFTDPMLQVVAAPEWRWLSGGQQGNDPVLEQVERMLDTYYGRGPLSLTVQVGIAQARKPA
jgi:ubiquinone/menaquinone biosynthesis C-methylase UbiE